MPYPIGLNSVLEVTLMGKQAQQQVMTVLHYRLSETPAPLDDGAAALDEAITKITLAGGLADKWLACLSEDVYDIVGHVQWITPARYSYKEFPIGGGTGTVAHPAMPVNVATAITKRTEDVGRQELGTIHMPGVPQTFVDGSLLSLAALPPYQELIEKVQATILVNAGTVPLIAVIFRRSAPASSPLIDNCILQLNTRVMYRRTVGVGS